MQPAKPEIFEISPVEDIHHYFFEKSFQAVEISYLFKQKFGRLIDQNIIAIHIDPNYLYILRPEPFEGDHPYGYTPYKVMRLPLYVLDRGIALYRESLLRPLKLFEEAEQIEEHKTTLQRALSEPKEPKPLDFIIEDVLNSMDHIEVEHLREMKLFGHNEMIYEMMEAYQERSELEEQLDELRETHEESVKYLIGLAKELSEKPASTIQNRLMSQFEKNFKSSSAMGSFDSDADTRWDEVGYCTQEGVFADVVFDDVKKALYALYNNLAESSQLAIKLSIVDEDELDFDYDEAIGDVTSGVDLDEYFDNLTREIVTQASSDWSDKIWDA